MQDTIQNVCTKCNSCQWTKHRNLKHGKLPEKVAEIVPWETLCADMTGPCTTHRKNKKDLELWAVAVINPMTGWFETIEVSTKFVDVAADTTEQTWSCQHPWPLFVTLDRGKEFMAKFSQMIRRDCGLKKKPITTRNPTGDGNHKRCRHDTKDAWLVFVT